jgi:cytochrome c-type biogenesis protein CcmH
MSAAAAMGLLSLAAVLWLLRPWWSARVAGRWRRRDANVAAYRQRIAEIERDRELGLISESGAAELRVELDRRLLSDVDDRGEETAATRAAPGALAAALALLVLGIAGGAYYAQGSWHTQGLVERYRGDPEGAQQAALELAVGRLSAELQEHPEESEGWFELGRALFALRQYEEAASAFGHYNRLTDAQDADVLVSEGEALTFAQGRSTRGRPAELFNKALKIAPANGRALWYGGLAALQEGDLRTAYARWTALSQQDLPDQLRDALTQRLAEMSAQMSPDDRAGALPSSEVALNLTVGVAPELAPRLRPDMALFVFARAADGPPMPLAVYRGKASELPREVRLDDSMAMTPAMKLSQFQRWRVTARVSASGQAQPQPGDLQGSMIVEASQSAQPLSLTIDELVR